MADPVSIGLMILGAGINVAGQMKQTHDAQVAANYQARQARNDRLLLRIQERVRQKQHKEQGERILGEQAATYGKAGVQMTGSALMMLTHTAGEIEKDAYLMNRETEIKLSRLRESELLYLQQGQDAGTAGALNILGAGLSLGNNLSGLLTPKASPAVPDKTMNYKRRKGEGSNAYLYGGSSY
jgi:hypothetical protein